MKNSTGAAGVVIGVLLFFICPIHLPAEDEVVTTEEPGIDLPVFATDATLGLQNVIIMVDIIACEEMESCRSGSQSKSQR